MTILKIFGIIFAAGFLILFLWSFFKVASGSSEMEEEELKKIRRQERKAKKWIRLLKRIAELYQKLGRQEEAKKALDLVDSTLSYLKLRRTVKLNDKGFINISPTEGSIRQKRECLEKGSLLCLFTAGKPTEEVTDITMDDLKAIKKKLEREVAELSKKRV